MLATDKYASVKRELAKQQMSTPDDPVIHSPPSLRGAPPSALLAGSPGVGLGSLTGRQQNGVGVPSIAGALQATADNYVKAPSALIRKNGF
uniref:TraO protein n=1 Tax=Ascaris lumbricoides TaxID=6252 RepID=A0A0M3ICU3_ASCLU